MSAALSHEEFEELAAGYALWALDPGDRHLFEQHLSGCSLCQSLVSDYEEVSGRLALGADQLAPPAELWDRIRVGAGLEVTAEQVGRAHPRRTLRESAEVPAPRRPATGAMRWLAAAAAIVLIVALGAWNASLRAQAHRAQQRLEALQPIQDLIDTGDVRAISLRGPNEGRMTVLTSPSRGAAALVADRVSDPGDGKVYELWVISSDAAPRPSAVFRPNADGRAAVRLPALPPANATLAVTVEPGPSGSAKPTTSPVMVESRI